MKKPDRPMIMVTLLSSISLLIIFKVTYSGFFVMINHGGEVLQPVETRMLKAQMMNILENASVAYISISIAQIIVVIGLWPIYSHELLLFWLAANQATVLYRYFICQSYSARTLDQKNLQRLKQQLFVAAFSNGILWGGLVWLLPPEWNIYSFVVLLPLLGISAAAMNLSSILPIYLALVTPIIIQVMGALIFSQVSNLIIAALFFIFYLGVLGVAIATSQMLKHTYQLQFDLESLNQELVVQKQVADEANTSKSRFLAAASHDLRQPLHAMELFLGSLSQNLHDNNNLSLVSRLRQSLETMQDMFGSLLDLSRFDAGVIMPELRHVSAQEVLHGLLLKYEVLAQEKGLELRVHPSNQWLHTDPVLLQRVVDNFLSNSIRHTDQGGIVVGCRKRGERLNIEVWDTGKGIPASELDMVFDAFHQLNNPERDRNKGVGLGLSIVSQISDLLEVPVAVYSKVGRGSMFSVSVALGHVEQQEEPSGVMLPLVDNTIFDDLDIWIVDDDQDILDAQQLLLEAWGCYSSAFSGFEAVKLAIDKGKSAPEIIISDFRLRQHENGIDIIEYIQQAFKSDIPALLITGDTGAEQLRLVHQSSFTLLHKPVSPVALKEAISNVVYQSDKSANI